MKRGVKRSVKKGNKNLYVVLAIVAVIVIGYLIYNNSASVGLSPDVFQGWGACTDSNKCESGVGDCDRHSNCLSGYCAEDVGRNYGESRFLDVCEATTCGSVSLDECNIDSNLVRCVNDYKNEVEEAGLSNLLQCVAIWNEAHPNLEERERMNTLVSCVDDYKNGDRTLSELLGCIYEFNSATIRGQQSAYFHSADTNKNWKIEIGETTGYCAGDTESFECKTTANIWQNGEEYYWDVNANNWLLKLRSLLTSTSTSTCTLGDINGDGDANTLLDILTMINIWKDRLEMPQDVSCIDYDGDEDFDLVDLNVALQIYTGNSPLRCVQGQVLGDVDGDGIVTEIDADLIGFVLVGAIDPPSDISCVDVNGDGVLQMNDALFIGQYAAGLRDSFDVSSSHPPVTATGASCASPYGEIVPISGSGAGTTQWANQDVSDLIGCCRVTTECYVGNPAIDGTPDFPKTSTIGTGDGCYSEGSEIDLPGVDEQNVCSNGVWCKKGFHNIGSGNCVANVISCQSGQMIGDANGDGNIDSLDAQLISDIHWNRVPDPTNVCCVDVNEDGNVDLSDGLIANRIYFGTASSPGVCV